MAIFDALKGSEPSGKEPASTPEPHEQNTNVQERLKKLEDRMAEFTSALEPLRSEAAALKSLPAEFNSLRQELANLVGDPRQEWLSGCSGEEQASLENARLELENLQEVLRIRQAPAGKQARSKRALSEGASQLATRS